eukprot:10420506-Alexandrium_andersonii.AAC.1
MSSNCVATSWRRWQGRSGGSLAIQTSDHGSETTCVQMRLWKSVADSSKNCTHRPRAATMLSSSWQCIHTRPHKVGSA